MGCFLLGPLGDLREVRGVQRGVQVARARASNEFTSLNGHRYIQRGPRGPRSWEVNLGQWLSPEQVAYITALADGTIPGPHYLYSQDAADANLLAVDVASPGAMGVSGLLGPGGGDPARGRVPALVGGVLTSLVGVNGAPDLEGERTLILPLPPGEYRLSAWSTAAGVALAWYTVTADYSPVDQGTVTTAAHGGGFRGQSSITIGGGAVGLSVALPAMPDPSVYVGALRLTAGSTQSTDWLPGRGVPEVVVDDPGETLQLLAAGEVRSDYTVTLREVG